MISIGTAMALPIWAQETSEILPNPHGFEMSLWAREPLLRNPVALTFDDRGRLFVVETTRRGTVDIDIRSHKDWAYDDLKNQSISQLRLFFREKMSPARSDANAAWLIDRNNDGSHDWRDLETMKERVYRLADRDGDNIADESVVFAEGFNEEFNGVIAGVMPWKDSVWVTVYPDLWRFHDRDDDGQADPDPSRLRGFGVHAAYDGHDIHGLTLGPEGKVYFSVGDNGFSVVTLEGRRLHYPNTGGVLRMNADGSDLEVFAWGLRNVQEIAFDDYGNLFSVDNDGDIEDERERFVHIMEGSDSGWRLNWQFRNRGWTRTMDQPFYNPWIHESMWVPSFPEQPAYITPPLANYSVGPGGFKINPGTALNDSYRGYFFLAQFPVQKITAFTTRPKGASFEMVNEHVFHFGLMASAMNFGPDGAMYIADWDGKWQPNERGAIHRLDDPRQADSPLRQEVERLLFEGFEQRSAEELQSLLGHQDRRIRQRAQGALASQNEGQRLLRIAQSEASPQLARIHALWGMVELRGDSLEGVSESLPFADSDPEIRAQSAKVAGDLRLVDSVSPLTRLLDETQGPRVQSYAAIALGKLGVPFAVPALIRLIARNADADPFLRHAGVMGLTGCASPEVLRQLVDQPQVSVRVAAVIALRRLRSAHVETFLSDSEPRVVAEAARAIHDDFSIAPALPSLAALLDSDRSFPGVQEEAIVRRVINANLRLGGHEHARRVLRYALDPGHPVSMRREAIDTLAVWNRRPYLDRVTGRARNLGPRNATLGDAMLQEGLATWLSSGAPILVEAATDAIQRRSLTVDEERLSDWVTDATQPISARRVGLELLARGGSRRFPKALHAAFQSQSSALRLSAIRLEADFNPQAHLQRHQHLEDYSLAEQQHLVAQLRPMSSPDATRLVLNYLSDLVDDRLPSELALDVVNLAASHTNPIIRKRWNQVSASLNPTYEADDYRFSLSGGNANRGKQVYQTHVAAQCVRCHNAGGLGRQVGPVLQGIGARVDRAYLLESLLDPSRSIAPGFQNASIELNDGEIYDGVIVGEGDAYLKLALPLGGIQRIPLKDIHSRQISRLSAMPSMKGILSPGEIRDLVAYLATL